jgi:hypothetical protein
MKINSLVGILSLALAALALTQTTAVARSGCLPRPELFKLESDTVHWSMVIGAGSECVQGLRGKTMLLEDVSIVDQPKTGRLVLEGPAFLYSANAVPGADSFKLSVTGTSARIHGNSFIVVDVAVQ